MKTLIKTIVTLAIMSQGVSAEEQYERPERITARLDKGAIVLLADVTMGSEGISVVPREIWKGEGIRLGEAILIPKRNPAQSSTGPCLSVVCFDFQPTYDWWISGTDGNIVGGMADVTIAGLRKYFQGGPNHLPKVTSAQRSTATPSQSTGAPQL
jgi:hypothetical protein